MYAHDKRHSCGSLMPNIFFTLQLIGIGLVSYMFVEIAPLLNVSTYVTYGMLILAVGVILNCIDKRQMVIRRQKFC